MTDVRKLLPVLLATIALQPCAHAADPPTTPAASAEKSPAVAVVDEGEQVDDGLKRFGYLAGLARLLGTDRAFLFSSAFGYGTTVEVETKDCVEVLKNYDQAVAKFRAGRGEQK